MNEGDLDRRIGDALRRRPDAFTPDIDRAARRLFGPQPSTGNWWVVGAAAAAALVLVGVSWWALSGSDDRDALDVITPAPTPSTTVADDAWVTAPSTAPLAVLRRRDPAGLRGHVGLMHDGEPFSAQVQAEGPIALSPGGTHLAFVRPTPDRPDASEVVVRRLDDGTEDIVDSPGVTCMRYSVEGRLATLGGVDEDGASVFTLHDLRLNESVGMKTRYISCPEWEVGGERAVAIANEGDDRLVAWTLAVPTSLPIRSYRSPIEGLHIDSRVVLGPSLERGRFLMLASSQHPPFSIVHDRWEVGVLVVGDSGNLVTEGPHGSRYERITELAAVPDWTNPDRVLSRPGPPVALGMVRPEIRDDGTLVLARSDSPTFLVADRVNGNLFALDLDGQVRYLTTGVAEVAVDPQGLDDDHVGVPLAWPAWVKPVPAMSPSPCEGPVEVEVDFTGDGLPDRAFHEWLGGYDTVLGVCLGDGRVDSVQGMGQAQIGGRIRLGPGGPAVLIAGGTSVSWGSFDVAVVIDGRIRWVDFGGEVLWFWDGQQRLGDDGLFELVGANGCEDLTGDGVDELVQVEVEKVGDGGMAAWEKRAYRIDGNTASLVSTDGGTVAHMGDLWDVEIPMPGSCASIE